MSNNEVKTFGTKVLGNLQRGLAFIISAPAGTGKTTLATKLMQEYSNIKGSISYTTRKPRAGEQDGIDYHFVSEEIFQQKIQNNDFLEWATVFDHHYGTCRQDLEGILSKGFHAVLVIDTQGALNIMKHFSAISIFVSPPSFEELQNRLFSRSTESKSIAEQRLSWAKHEIEHARLYDYHIINNNLSTAYTILKSIFIAEEHRSKYVPLPF